ncbi:MAG: PD40 domain-containing protein [Bacteroidia bacterium]|nr:PD40 domain-containing protein [Bacteroidia bacterium]
MRLNFRILLTIAAFGAVSLCQGQQSREVFGKNRIQYKQFNWQYISSENFDVYYYDERRRIATEAIQYLEGEFDRITDLIGYPPYLKTKVFLYNSITDLQQSNIGLNKTQYNVGGETDFIKPIVEIAHPGNLDEFKEELIYKMADLMVNEMMFGGSLKDMFQNAVLLNLPEWFINGASSYVSKGWNIEMDDYVRQLVRDKKITKALRFTGDESALVGQSIWNYIVEKYGRSSISNILNYTRVIRNEQKSVLITLGISFKQLMADWQNYYSDMEEKVSLSYISPSDSSKFSPSHHRSVVYTTVKISPDGKKIAYAENDRGRFVVKVKSLESGRETTIINGGNRVIDQDVDFRVPLLSWADQNTLGVIGVNRGEYVFWLYDLSTRSKLPRQLDRFSNIRSFDFSGNGRLAVLSADAGGQNDLFLISSRNDRTKRLTNDLYDDLDPSFIPNTNSIVFSSNRTTDTVNNIVKGYDRTTSTYNLYAYNLDTTTNKVELITNTVSKNFYPKAIDQDNYYFLSDQRGIVNLFKFNRVNGIYSQVTNFDTSIKEYDLDFYNRSLALVMNKDLSEDIFLINNFNFDRQIFTPSTRRKEIQLAKVVSERRKQKTVKPMTIKELINSRLQEKNDTISQSESKPVFEKRDSIDQSNEINTDDYSFDTHEVAKDTLAKPIVPIVKEKSVDTEDYVFEDDADKGKSTETFLTRYMKARESNRLTGPFTYQPRFSYENLVTNFVIDPLRGFSIKLEAQMNDMLENFRFFGGVQTAFDWKSGDVFGEVQYLPHLVDYSIRVDRKVVFWDGLGEQTPNYQKYSLQRLEFGASLPLTVRARVSLKPFLGYTRYVDRGSINFPAAPPTFLPTAQQFYAGSKAELVYDNSITTGLNIIEGSRGKISFVHHEGMGNKNSSFSQVSIDLRHYQKIYKEIVFAVRGYTGTFFGESPKKYVLGGMDNWFGNRFNEEGSGNPLVNSGTNFNNNLVFTEFATSLRGFDYATLYGNSVALLNAELRVPLIRALSGGPIASNFFRNMQFTAFYDIGSSWTGAVPFKTQNSVRTREVDEGPFEIDLKEYLNPWLYSYGFGFRSMMLGYYIKLDLAWPVENYKVKDPRVFVTLGFDF